MKRVIEFFLDRPLWGNAAIAIILMFGLFSVFTMKRSFFPEMEPLLINVSVYYPGASPQEMEEGVTIKLEQAVKGLVGIDETNATSAENIAQITVKAENDTDMDELLNEIENAVSSINSFPKGAEQPLVTMNKSNGMASIVAFVGVSAKEKNAKLTDLTDMATKIERDLLDSKEITQITMTGFPEKEISVNVREQELLRYGISFQEISLAISARNIDITPGTIRGGIEEINLRSNSRGTTKEEIEAIVVRTSPTGDQISIKDVADVTIGFSESSQDAKYNGFPCVQFQIEKTKDQDITTITESLHEYQAKFAKENVDYSFDIYYEFNDMLADRIDLLSRNGIVGLILVLLFLGIFLNLKLSAWVAFGIPFSFLGMFVFGMPYGMSINMISLFGMILVVGILVDDGIVIAENIYTHYEKGKTPRRAAIDGTMEVLTSVFSSVITTIVAFSILLFVEGMEMMREMAFVAISCLIFSLVEAFIILPAHLGHESVLNDKTKKESWSYLKGGLFMLAGLVVIFFSVQIIPAEHTFGMMLLPFVLVIGGVGLFLAGYSKSKVEQMVRGGADKGIKHVRDRWFKAAIQLIVGTRKKWYIVGFIFPLVFTFGIFSLLSSGGIPFTIFPDIPPDFINIEAAYMPGDSKVKSEKFIQSTTSILMEENQRIIDESGDTLIAYFSSNIGFSQNIEQVGNHTCGLMVFLNSDGVKTPADTLMNRLIRRLDKSPDAQLAQETFVGGFNRFGKEIELGLTAENQSSLVGARDLFKKELMNKEGVINIKDNMPEGKKEVYLKMRPQADIYGIAKNDVLTQIRQGFFGQEAQRVIIGTDEVKIWVRYPVEDRNSMSDLENMKVKSPQGLAIPLKEICDFEFGRAPESLKRRDGQRIVKIDADVADPDKVAEINNYITDSIIPKVAKAYPDVVHTQLGQALQGDKTQDSMMMLSLIGVVIMFIILSLHFNSVFSSFLIMLVIPAGVAGAILGHGLIGIPVSLFSFFGMIALLGVLVNDAIVFLDRYNDLLVEGMDTRKAAIEASVSRFRPIILTSLTTVVGLLPIISETNMQAQFLIPVATSLAFGVLFGTLFILLFYPAAILFWNGLRRFGRFFWHGERNLPARNVEPALKLINSKNDIDV
ncbi:MAG: multidrug efflux pump subunit AcrB [Crocinitomicaceae bacterium]|jgi:multidrug efflux pump subunit AcrB